MASTSTARAKKTTPPPAGQPRAAECRIWPESKMPMTAAEHELFEKARVERLLQLRTPSSKSWCGDAAKADERARRAGERAVLRARGRRESAAERTLDLWGSRS